MYDVEFENDVKTYGTQTNEAEDGPKPVFENDVKTYGTQTIFDGKHTLSVFENDVKTYGTQTIVGSCKWQKSLRMM